MSGSARARVPLKDVGAYAMGTENVKRWLPFFESFFPTRTEARVFVESLEALRLSDPRHQAKIMMHQTQRLISLSDDLPQIRKGNEGLRLLFLLVCAENIAKLANKYEGEGQSKAYARNFFIWFLTPGEQEILCVGITHHDRRPLSLQQAIDALYGVRCDVVHEGKYWGFHFNDGKTPMLNTEPDVIVSLTLEDFRALVVRGCIRAIERYPHEPQPAVQADGVAAASRRQPLGLT